MDDTDKGFIWGAAIVGGLCVFYNDPLASVLGSITGWLLVSFLRRRYERT
jgi:hypothetical protein